MACREWQDKIQAYADGELPEADQQAFEGHRRSCPACATAALDAIAAKRLVRQAGRRFAPSAALRGRVEKQFARRSPSSIRLWIPSFAAAAVLLLVVFVGGLQWVRESRNQALAELSDLHVATLASATPVDVLSSDRHTVKPWFAGKIPFTFNLPELQGSAFTLIGGRVTYFQQEPGAHLVFQVRQHRISVFIFRDSGGAVAQFKWLGSSGSHSAFHYESWSAGGLRYFILSDVSTEDVRQLSGLLRAAQ